MLYSLPELRNGMLRLQQQLECLGFRTKRQRLTRRQLALKRLSLPRCSTTPNGSMNGVCVSKAVLAQAGTILTSRSLRVRSASALPEAPSLQAVRRKTLAGALPVDAFPGERHPDEGDGAAALPLTCRQRTAGREREQYLYYNEGGGWYTYVV